jgi:hypothetical protein
LTHTSHHTPPPTWWPDVQKQYDQLASTCISHLLLTCWTLLAEGMAQHDISTGVFGRAYLEVRAAYFTH